MRALTLISVLLFILFASTSANVCQYSCSCPYRAVFAKSTCPQVKTSIKSILGQCFKKGKKPVKKPHKPHKKPRKHHKKPKHPKKPKKPCSRSHFLSKKTKKCVRRTCPRFFKFSKKAKRCIKKRRCPKGQRFGTKKRRCYAPKCAAPQKWSKKQKKCVSKKCTKGHKWNKKQKRCVSSVCPKGYYQSKKTKKCHKKGCKRLHFKRVKRIIRRRIHKKFLKRKHRFIKRLKKSVECSLTADPHLKTFGGKRIEAQTAGDWDLYHGAKVYASYRGKSFGRWVGIIDWIVKVNGQVVRSSPLPAKTVVINGQTVTLTNNVKHNLNGKAFVLMVGNKYTVSSGDGEDVDFLYYTSFWNAYVRSNVADIKGLCTGQFLKSHEFNHPHAGKILPAGHIGKHCKKQKKYTRFCKKRVQAAKVRNCVFDLCQHLPEALEKAILKQSHKERVGHLIKVVKVVKVGGKRRGTRTLRFKKIVRHVGHGAKKIFLRKVRHGRVFRKSIFRKVIRRHRRHGRRFKKIIRRVRRRISLKLKRRHIKKLKKPITCEIFADPHVKSNGKSFEAQVAGDWTLYDGLNLVMHYRGKSFGSWVGITEWIAFVRGAKVRNNKFSGVTVNGKPVTLKNGVKESLPNGGWVLQNGNKWTLSTNEGEEVDVVSGGSYFNMYIRTNFPNAKGVCAHQFIKSHAFNHPHNHEKPIKQKKCKKLKKYTKFCKGNKQCIFDLCAGLPKKMEEKIRKEVKKEEHKKMSKKVKGCGVKLCKAPLKWSASKNKCIKGKCPQFFKWSKKVNRCIKLQRCKKGFSFSLKKGDCLPKRCPTGHRFSKKHKKCVAKKCQKRGERWNKKQKKCTFRRCPKHFHFSKKSNKCVCSKRKKIVKIVKKIIRRKHIHRRHKIINRLKKSVECTLLADPHLKTFQNVRKEAQTAGDWVLYKGFKLEAHYRGKSFGRWVGIVDWLIIVKGVVVRNSKLPAKTITVDGEKVTLIDNLKYKLKNGGFVEMKGNKYTISSDDGEDVDMYHYGTFFNAYVRTNIPSVSGLCSGQFTPSTAFNHPHKGKILKPHHIGNCKNKSGYKKSCKKQGLTGEKLRNCIFDLCQHLPKEVEKEFIRVSKKEKHQHVHQNKKFKIIRLVKKIIVRKGKKILKRKVTKRDVKRRYIPHRVKRQIIKRLAHSVKCELYADPHALGLNGNRFEAQTEGDWDLYKGVQLELSYRGKKFGGWVGVIDWIAKVKGTVVRNSGFAGQVTIDGKAVTLKENTKEPLPYGGWVLKSGTKVTVSTDKGEEFDAIGYGSFFNMYVRSNVPLANVSGICAQKFVKSTVFNHPHPGKIDADVSLKRCKHIKKNRSYCTKRRHLKGEELKECVYDLCQKLPKALEKRILHRNHKEFKKHLSKRCKRCAKRLRKVLKKIVIKRRHRHGGITRLIKKIIKKVKVGHKAFKTIVRAHVAHIHHSRGIVKRIVHTVVHHHSSPRGPSRGRGRRGVSVLGLRRRRRGSKKSCKRRVVRNYVVALIKTIKGGLILPSTPSKVTNSLWKVALRKLRRSRKCLKCAKKVSAKCISKVTTATINAYKRCTCTAQNYKGKSFAAFSAKASKKCQKMCKK